MPIVVTVESPAPVRQTPAAQENAGPAIITASQWSRWAGVESPARARPVAPASSPALLALPPEKPPRCPPRREDFMGLPSRSRNPACPEPAEGSAGRDADPVPPRGTRERGPFGGGSKASREVPCIASLPSGPTARRETEKPQVVSQFAEEADYSGGRLEWNSVGSIPACLGGYTWHSFSRSGTFRTREPPGCDFVLCCPRAASKGQPRPCQTVSSAILVRTNS
jgi:hypothetical protein